MEASEKSLSNDHLGTKTRPIIIVNGMPVGFCYVHGAGACAIIHPGWEKQATVISEKGQLLCIPLPLNPMMELNDGVLLANDHLAAFLAKQDDRHIDIMRNGSSSI